MSKYLRNPVYFMWKQFFFHRYKRSLDRILWFLLYVHVHMMCNYFERHFSNLPPCIYYINKDFRIYLIVDKTLLLGHFVLYFPIHWFMYLVVQWMHLGRLSPRMNYKPEKYRSTNSDWLMPILIQKNYNQTQLPILRG